MKNLFIFTFFLCTVWDFATSFLGIVGVFGISEFDAASLYKVNDLTVYITAIVTSLAILSLSLLSEIIWRSDTTLLYRRLRLPHMIAILFDAYTSFLGTAQNVILRQGKTTFIDIDLGDIFSQVTLEQGILLFIITMMVTISPLVLSQLNAKSLATQLNLPQNPPKKIIRRRVPSPQNPAVSPPQYPHKLKNPLSRSPQNPPVRPPQYPYKLKRPPLPLDQPPRKSSRESRDEAAG
ncbi:MAG: hypothetical protein F6K11_00785 [Leptolyngbya sp. SIO3F4]|nr:hypothetical protein [Leptolyngbya sp. SIO3F4]